ncbi:bifunctional phosphopantothenoylcysteine decarboxylase/phosphopantothenate--cysteine ligase CoaBC [Candidatus Bipolaricaulota bacterium]|nr:bifunctional phosphopantothenoylcysteine decarboxylase/phosphopantothenate--cysteine ligase CoaBC [Candidatus Bipolaricaulota bacterium]TFH09309.1 MAG: bifunctional phosphopantothenoylcysteine decarboxylase/phosphopantothenate--cysteine ligase CoaBC [Candidatus Atribacteria bacterium]
MPERHVVLGVSGSIAAYKAVDLASKLTQAGVAVHTVMTEAATQLVGPATFRAITGLPVSTSMFDLTNPYSIEHISLSEVADLMLIAPCTANVMAKLATGIADDLLTCTALATRAPILIAPAMHTAMWENAATQANLKALQDRGMSFVGPAVGRLASGGFGAGRFAPVADILGWAMALMGADGDLAGHKLVITAGGTRESIDPIRFLTNRSTGKMGFALAEAARDRGAAVTLISAPTFLAPPAGMSVFPVESAAQMLDVVEATCVDADVLIMAAAVADYTPEMCASEKLKKEEIDIDFVLPLNRTEDILATITGVPIRVGFAAESENMLENAKGKLIRKNLDLIIANDISRADSGMGADNNECTILDASGNQEDLPLMPKREVADRILDRIVALLEKT